MNQSVKAALLSAFVFPGLGQIVNGYKKRGWSFIAVISVLLVLIISKLVQQALMVLDEIQQRGTVVDINEISKISSEVVSFSDNIFLNSAFILLILTWLVSIIDAYRLGKK
jgi:TM2 domain-containing membrane protein YozV